VSRILLLDEPGPQRDMLAAILAKAGHQLRTAGTVMELRRLRKQFSPQLSLVELVRLDGNGFTLALFLQKIAYGVPVLMSDRGLESDRLWAHSRGLELVISRSGGIRAFLQEIDRIGGGLEHTVRG